MRSVCVIPPRIEALPAQLREAARIRYVIRAAATWYSDGGGVSALSEGIGFGPNNLHVVMQKEKIPFTTALLLEKVLGRDCFPRELFCPELALPEQA